MFVQVNGARLYFDVEGTGLVPDGPAMRQEPTLVLLHGGPGFDHALYKPALPRALTTSPPTRRLPARQGQVLKRYHRPCARNASARSPRNMCWPR
jgi:pimeloyl-ACP methyl ester carboxylesterase